MPKHLFSLLVGTVAAALVAGAGGLGYNLIPRQALAQAGDQLRGIIEIRILDDRIEVNERDAGQASPTPTPPQAPTPTPTFDPASLITPEEGDEEVQSREQSIQLEIQHVFPGIGFIAEDDSGQQAFVRNPIEEGATVTITGNLERFEQGSTRLGNDELPANLQNFLNQNQWFIEADSISQEN